MIKWLEATNRGTDRLRLSDRSLHLRVMASWPRSEFLKQVLRPSLSLSNLEKLLYAESIYFALQCSGLEFTDQTFL